ncbi:UNVERIFIED_CONTAM: hypothetical protein GTU68_035102 [Idotea baltica]|nr:hypothetical protein [Idotea baltica]
MDTIEVRGARTHNLKNIDLDIPRDKLVVITGLSGSGKSSLAFDTLYAEGQRRYVESLSTYARQFLSMMEKPDIDHIEGLSPAISIEQKSTSHNPRSTVGTITEIYDYLRLLYARVGDPRCPEHGLNLQAQTISQMVDTVLALPEGSKLMLLAPVVRGRKGEHLHVFEELRASGFVRARIDGIVTDLDDVPELEKNKKHHIDVVVDRLKVRDDLSIRLAESFETALGLTDGLACVSFMDRDGGDISFSARFACPECGHSIDELEPRLFSFNNPAGACAGCDGLGIKQYFDEDRIVLHPEASVAEGAIRGWDRRNVYYFHMLNSLAEHYGFDIDTPYEKLKKTHRQYILQGSGDEEIAFSYVNDRGDVFKRTHAFEGIIPNMNRRYRDTDSQSVREELAKFLASQDCPDCGGTRYKPGRFSFNVKGGRCEACQGDGVTKVEMHFLPDIFVPCDICKSKRYNRETLEVRYKGKNIHEVLEMTVEDALQFFEPVPAIARKLQTLMDVGLSYIRLGQAATTLSGGEAQRVKLSRELSKRDTGSTLYILDEPTTGLHFEDIKQLLEVLHRLRDHGNTVVIIEHNLDVVKTADWVIDLGPEGGSGGGQIIASGTPETVADTKGSYTGQYLKPLLAGSKKKTATSKRKPKKKAA